MRVRVRVREERGIDRSGFQEKGRVEVRIEDESVRGLRRVGCALKMKRGEERREEGERKERRKGGENEEEIRRKARRRENGDGKEGCTCKRKGSGSIGKGGGRVET